jgi:hypothetical protein
VGHSHRRRHSAQAAPLDETNSRRWWTSPTAYIRRRAHRPEGLRKRKGVDSIQATHTIAQVETKRLPVSHRACERCEIPVATATAWFTYSGGV